MADNRRQTAIRKQRFALSPENSAGGPSIFSEFSGTRAIERSCSNGRKFLRIAVSRNVVDHLALFGRWMATVQVFDEEFRRSSSNPTKREVLDAVETKNLHQD